MTDTTNTLDGMSVAQLRDLAARAEATAKQKEAKSTYVELGRTLDGYMWRYSVKDKRFEAYLPISQFWNSYYTEFTNIVVHKPIENLKDMNFLLTRYIDLKERGLIK